MSSSPPQKSALESHIYKVNLEDGTKTQLSKGEGSHGIRMAPAGDYYVHTYSNLTTPTMTELCDVNGEQTWLMSDGAMPGLKDYYYSVPEIHTIKSDDGEVDLYVSIVKPHNFDENKKYPVMVSIYGGPGSGGGVSNRFAYRAGQQFWAQEGVILFNVANRGTNNRGRDFMKIVHKNLGHYELTDYVTGVNWLKTHKWVDGSKVSIEGYSYGGYMTLMAMNKAPDTFQFGVCGSPVTDWRFYDTIYTERYMDTPQSNPEGYKESAPIHFADAFKGKLLLTHGTMDNNVHLANAMVMAEEYQRAGKEFEFYLYARERHGIRARHRSMHRRKVIFSFYMKNLLGTEIDWNTYQKPEAEEKEAE